MPAQPVHQDEIRLRLDQVERELRRWRRGAILALSLAAVAFAGAMADPPAQELRVKTLRVVDDDGKDRIILTAERGVPDMTFLDPAGEARLTLDIADDRSPIVIVSDSGRTSNRVTLGMERGSPRVQIYDADAKKGVSLCVPTTGSPLIRIFDENGKLRSRFP